MARGARATRRSLLAALLAASVLPPRFVHAAGASRGYLEDFELLRRTLATRYAYLDAAAARRWTAAQRAARKAAATATSAEWAALLEAALASFRDDHVMLVE